MADRKILQFQLEDGRIAEFEVPEEPMLGQQSNQERGLQGIGDWAATGAQRMAGDIASKVSSFSPIGDYTLDIAGALLPYVSGTDLRNLANQYRKENPIFSTAEDILGGFGPAQIYKTVGAIGRAASKSPVATNLVESFIQGSARPYAQEEEPGVTLGERAIAGGGQAALTGGITGVAKGIGAGSKAIYNLLTRPKTDLSEAEQQIVKILEQQNVADLTPERVGEALQRQEAAAQAGQGGMETIAESLGEGPKGIAGAYAQGPKGREIAIQALEGRTSPEVLRQQMEAITEPLGPVTPFLKSQKEGFTALQEMRDRAQAALSRKGEKIYEGAFKEEVPFVVLGDYGQPITPQRIGEFPYQVAEPAIKYSEEITRASKDPLYKKLASRVIATTYPKGETAPDIRSLEVADRVASQIKSALKDPARYAQQTAIDVAEIPANKLLKTIEQELVGRDVTLPKRRAAYEKAAREITGLTREQSELVGQILGGGTLGKPGAKLIGANVDPDTFTDIVKAVEKQSGQKGLDQIKSSVAGVLRRAYSQRQGQKLIDAPFEKGDERFRKIATLVGEEKATEMLSRVRRLTDFVKFKNQILGGSPTQPRQEMAKQVREADEAVSKEVENFLSYASGNKSLKSGIKQLALKFISSKKNPLSNADVANYLFSQGDSAVTKLQATQKFLRDMQKNKQGKETLDRFFNGYISRELQQAFVDSGLTRFSDLED